MQILNNNFYMIKQICRFSKTRVIFMTISTFFTLVNDLILNVLFLPFIISAVANNYTVFYLLCICGIMIAVRIIIELYNTWMNNIYIPKSDTQIEQGFNKLIYEKIQSVDLIKYDDPEFYNNSIWVLNDISKRSVAVLNTFFGWFGDVLMVGTVITIILSFEPILLICTVFPSIIALLFNNKINNLSYLYDKENIQPDRQMGYVNKTFTSVAFAKELRLFPNIFKPLTKMFNMSVKTKDSSIKKYGSKMSILLSLVAIFTIFFSHVIGMVYLAYKTIVIHTIDAGIVITLTNSIWQVSARIDSLFGIITQMQKHSLYISNYKKFLSIENSIKQNESGMDVNPGANSIRLEHISYKYPNSDDYVLKDINMDIKQGEKVAIVGQNGAGKTTLIKLIMRLYLPQEGVIYIDDRPESTYKLSSLYKNFGVIFQDFQLYALNVSENIIMDECCESIDESLKVNSALEKSGLYNRIYEEKNNIKASVMKEYDEDGLILSGGQAQKLAIARIFANEFGVVIMDEPSSALDPVSEYEMHMNMLEAAKDKTVILISHRLSTTKDADKIYYFENGEIIEEGSHQKLMKQNGKYAKMFNLQAEKYSDSKVQEAV